LQSAAGSSKDSEAVPWVETGTAVSQQYAAAREEASDHARLRNQCFQQATVAFLAGDKVRQAWMTLFTHTMRHTQCDTHEHSQTCVVTYQSAGSAPLVPVCQ
jgi:plastocyanin